MTLNLPAPFVERMRELLQDEFDRFMQSYDEPRYYGLRVNPLKVSVEQFRRMQSFHLETIPWVKEGFYYEEEDRPGKHPYYHLGLYYIQEPSAMVPVECLDVQPGERVLDLCAAPGGKSTQIAAKLQQQGLLVSNDPSAERAKALVKNIELMGVKNAVVLNETPERIAQRFPHYFHKILVDAPCSGEGMFRKDAAMSTLWKPDWVSHYAQIQKQVLAEAAKMLVNGGRIVYSTCTFSPEENEAIIADFLDKHPSFKVITPLEIEGFQSGRGDWLEAAGIHQLSELSLSSLKEQVQHTIRLWPQFIKGEGHFVAVLQHQGGSADSANDTSMEWAAHYKETKHERLTAEELDHIAAFFQNNLNLEAPKHLVSFKGHVYAIQPELPSLQAMKVVRPGLYLGMVKKDRFEPSQPLAMALKADEAKYVMELAADALEAVKYLKGDTLELSEAALERWGLNSQPKKKHKGEAKVKRYCLVCLDGHPAGWGKINGHVLKNEYPPGWRWL